MKMPSDLYNDLSAALAPLLIGKSGISTMRVRWDALWASNFTVNRFYNAGLNDDHIDSALRKIFRSYGQFKESN